MIRSGWIRCAIGCFLAIASLAVVPAQSAEEGYSLAVTFIPVKEKTQKLVTVELIRHGGGETGRYATLEKAVLSGGWRAERKGDFYEIPGKCTVEMLASERYVVDCWLVHARGQDVLREEVKTCEDVVMTITTFSRLRLFRQPSKKEKMIKITIA